MLKYVALFGVLSFCSVSMAEMAPYEVIEASSSPSPEAVSTESVVVMPTPKPVGVNNVNVGQSASALSPMHELPAPPQNESQEADEDLSTQVVSLLGKMENVEHQQEVMAKHLEEVLKALKGVQEKLESTHKASKKEQGEEKINLPAPKESKEKKDKDKALPKEENDQEAEETSEGDSSLSPTQVYQKARSLISAGKYDLAERALLDFIKNYFDHELVGPAKYWLGETYFVQKKYTKAAATFAEGYKSAPKGIKAPDNLLKLAMSLKELDKNKEACATIKELLKNKNAPDAILNKAKGLKKRLPNCSS